MADGHIRVFCRVSPAAGDAALDGQQSVVVRPGTSAVVLQRPFYDPRVFEADEVLSARATQEEVFAKVAQPCVRDMLCSNHHHSILMYGQTGSGKTHTMIGEQHAALAPRQDDLNQGRDDLRLIAHDQAGLVPRALLQLCEAQSRAQRSGEPFELTMSAYEVYRERAVDLLRPAATPPARFVLASRCGRVSSGGDAHLRSQQLRVREDRQGVRLEGLTEESISGRDALAILRRAIARRAVGATDANASSSRSHAVFLIRVRFAGGRSSLLTMADLAGSERCAKSGCDGARLVEARAINQSITALGKCISALSERKRGVTGARPHIPFRDSMITRLLSQALGGSCRTTVCATLNPALSSYDENVSTMLFAARARAVRAAPVAYDQTPSTRLAIGPTLRPCATLEAWCDDEPLASPAHSDFASPAHSDFGADEAEAAELERDLHLVHMLRAAIAADALRHTAAVALAVGP